MRPDDVALEVRGVWHAYGAKRDEPSWVLEDVSLSVRRGTTLAIVGESGAGKSTLSRIVAGLERPMRGTVLVGGRPPRPRPGEVSPVQMIFQQPLEALNRFASVGASIAEPLLRMGRAERRRRVAELLTRVGIDPERAGERPRSFSGGQLQRIVTARALAAEPDLLLCDEPTSALDVSVQAQIVNLLLELQAAQGFACVLVTHDLGVARVLSDEVLVLRHGKVVEHTETDAFFSEPASRYGRELLDATAQQMLSGDTVKRFQRQVGAQRDSEAAPS